MLLLTRFVQYLMLWLYRDQSHKVFLYILPLVLLALVLLEVFLSVVPSSTKTKMFINVLFFPSGHKILEVRVVSICYNMSFSLKTQSVSRNRFAQVAHKYYKPAQCIHRSPINEYFRPFNINYYDLKQKQPGK